MPSKSESKKFKARLKALEGSALAWRVLDIPNAVRMALGEEGRMPVRGTVNGFPFRSSLFHRKNGSSYLLMNKQMQKASGALTIGARVEVNLERDDAPRKVAAPSVLKAALSDDPDLLKYFNALSYSTRKWIGDYCMQPKSGDAKERRASQIAMSLMEMRDGEEVAPPILQAEFARNPKARVGWKKLTKAQKRSHLWGIFYYKPGEARDRRVAKAIEVMVAHAEK